MITPRIKQLIILLIASNYFACTHGSAIAPVNFLQPYSVLLRPDLRDTCSPLTLAFYAEAGFSSNNYNRHNNKTNALHIWQCDQNTLAMLKGFGTNNKISQKSNAIAANDDGIRGHILADGNLRVDFAAAFSAYWRLGNHFIFSAHLPFYSMRLSDVCYQDLTQNILPEDIRVKELLTNNLATNIFTLGQGLDIGSWRRTGFGDITVLAEWAADFPQAKPMLKNVHVALRGGITIPTGKKGDEDLLMAFPFGNDHASSILGGLTLDLTLGSYLRIGGDVQLTHIFGSTRARRIKTDFTQTELFLLEKTDSYKDYGLTQQFSFFGECINLIPATSILIGYEYRKHGDDVLSLLSNAFSPAISTISEKLFDWTTHQCIIRANFDSSCLLGDDAFVTPTISVYTRLPFNGKRSAQTSTIGGILSLKF